MKEIVSSGIILARHIIPEDWQDGLNFFSNDGEYIQVGAWKYNSDTTLKRHIHNKVERIANRTYEALYIINGSLKADIYDINGTLIDMIIANKGDILILLESGHGYTILSDDTRVIEIKNGPYLGAEIDRFRF